MRAHERRRSRGDAPTVAGRRPQMNETRPDGFCRRVGDKRISGGEERNATFASSSEPCAFDGRVPATGKPTTAAAIDDRRAGRLRNRTIGPSNGSTRRACPQLAVMVFLQRTGAPEKRPAARGGRPCHASTTGSVLVVLDQLFVVVGVEQLVELDDFARDRGVDVRGRLDRLHHGNAAAGLHGRADLGQLDIDQIAELRLGVVGDTDPNQSVVFDAGPLVGLEEFQIAGNLAHDRVQSLGLGRVTDGNSSRIRREENRKLPAQMPSQALPSRTNGYFTCRTGTSRPRMSTRRSPVAPAGTRANAIALSRVGAKLPDRISPSPLAASTFWPWRSTPLPSSTRPIITRGTPLAFCRSSAARPMKSRPGSSETVQPRLASHGVTFSSMSWPYRFMPASSRKVSRAPRPAGFTPAACSASHSATACSCGSMISKPSSPV